MMGSTTDESSNQCCCRRRRRRCATSMTTVTMSPISTLLLLLFSNGRGEDHQVALPLTMVDAFFSVAPPPVTTSGSRQVWRPTRCGALTTTTRCGSIASSSNKERSMVSYWWRGKKGGIRRHRDGDGGRIKAMELYMHDDIGYSSNGEWNDEWSNSGGTSNAASAATDDNNYDDGIEFQRVVEADSRKYNMTSFGSFGSTTHADSLSSTSSSTTSLMSSPPLPKGFTYDDEFDIDETLDHGILHHNDLSGPSRLGYGVTYGYGSSGGGSNNIIESESSSSSSMEIVYDDDDEYNDYFDAADEGGMFTIEDPEIDGSIVADGTSSSSGGLSYGLYAPEVNKWTTLMADGTNAAIHRPGREMTLEEGMEILYNDLKDLSPSDYDAIEIYWDKLMPTVSYLGTVYAAKVKQALCVAYRAHRSQIRKSGEPFIIHPVEVALLLSGMKMDASTVMSGLLHDTVEDTDLTFEQVEGEIYVHFYTVENIYYFVFSLFC